MSPLTNLDLGSMNRGDNFKKKKLNHPPSSFVKSLWLTAIILKIILFFNLPNRSRCCGREIARLFRRHHGFRYCEIQIGERYYPLGNIEHAAAKNLSGVFETKWKEDTEKKPNAICPPLRRVHLRLHLRNWVYTLKEDDELEGQDEEAFVNRDWKEFSNCLRFPSVMCIRVEYLFRIATYNAWSHIQFCNLNLFIYSDVMLNSRVLFIPFDIIWCFIILMQKISLSLVIMGNNTEFQSSVVWLSENLTLVDARVNLVECNIRVLGGLVSGHLLATDSTDRLGEGTQESAAYFGRGFGETLSTCI
ncbi:hypothetical protein PRUPE_5G008500 [Prunus persica]|uniref:Uncharacterized protein n=1 Tax=Prunus persica TaxID=3760 RepID=A0A251P1G8_PRUPE|nr:hypothetical protein PRUPE_5G008500 [Prunus persica]